jgi:Flp pilus assembly protein TadG
MKTDTRFRRDVSGVAAIEAALLLPLLVLTSLGAIELAAALDARRAVDNASFSLVQSAAASSVVDRGRRARWVAGHDVESRRDAVAEGVGNNC